MWNHRRLQLRRLGVLAVVGALGLALSPTAQADPANPTSAVASQARTPVASEVRIATFNTAATRTSRQGFRDVRDLLAQGPDIVALQEMSSFERRSLVRERLLDCSTCQWDGWFPIPAVPGGLPILWRSDKFTLLGHDWFELAPATFVGDRGAGPATIRPRYVVRLRLEDNLTGRTLWILNTHFVPTVEGPNGHRNSNHRRTRLYAQHMAGLQENIDRIYEQEGGGLVFVAGDFNVNYRQDKIAQDPIFPYAGLATRRFRASYYALGEPATGTHQLKSGFDKRLIDYVHYQPTRRTIATGQQIIRGMNSDHRPLIVDFKVTQRGCWVKRKLVC